MPYLKRYARSSNRDFTLRVFCKASKVIFAKCHFAERNMAYRVWQYTILRYSIYYIEILEVQLSETVTFVLLKTI